MQLDASPSDARAHLSPGDSSVARNDTTDDHTQSAMPSSFMSGPTPAQRQKPALPSSSLLLFEPSDKIPVPNSSLPAASAVEASPTSRLPRSKRAVVRKVAQSPRDRSFHPDLSTLGNILVPNSDTSATASHSQPSQSQSQSQVLSHDSQSQSQREQRYAQSLSYSSESQDQQEPHDSGRGVEPSQEVAQERSQEHSQLRNEVLPPSDAPEPSDPLVDPQEETRDSADGRPDTSDHVSEPPALPTYSQTIPPSPAPRQSLKEASELPSPPATPGTVFKAPQEANDVVDSTQQEGRPLSPAEKLAVDGIVDISSDESQYADDEAEPDALPSDDSVSTRDEGAEPSDHSVTEDEEDEEEEKAAIAEEEEGEEGEEEEVDELDEELSEDDARVEEKLKDHMQVVSSSQRSPSASRVDPMREASPIESVSQTVTNLQPDAAVSLSSQHREARTPALPSSPDVFLENASFHRASSSRPPSPELGHFSIRQPSVATSNDDDGEVDEQEPVPIPEREPNPKPTPKLAARKKIAYPPTTASNHDPEIWSKPSFQSVRKSEKRPLSPQSITSDEEPRKKRKVESLTSRPATSEGTSFKQPLPRPHEVLSDSSSFSAVPMNRHDSIGSTTAKVKQIDLRRSGSISSGPSRAPSLQRETSGGRKATVRNVEVKATPGRVLEVDFQPMLRGRLSRETSRGSSVVPSGPLVASSSRSRLGDSRRASHIPLEHPAVSSSKPPPLNQWPPKRSPRKSGANSMRSPETLQSSSRVREKAPAPHAGHAARPPAQVVGPSIREELRSVLDVQPSDNLPPVTWSVLSEILLRTGKARRKERIRADAG